MSDKPKKVDFSDFMSQFTQATYDNSSNLLNTIVKLEDYCNKHLSGLTVYFDVAPSKTDLTIPEQLIIGYKGNHGNEPVSGQIAASIKNPQDETPVLSFFGGEEVPCAETSGEEMIGPMLRVIARQEACRNVYQRIKSGYD